MTDPSPVRPADDFRSTYARSAATVTTLADSDSLSAFELARAGLEELEAVLQQWRELRDQMVLRVREDRKLSLAQLADVLRWGVSRPRMQQIIDRARGQVEAPTTPAEPPAA